MSETKEDLSKFRGQIDEIDGKIIALLQGRIEIVRQVGKHKAKMSQSQSFIRAGREANMLRDLTQKIGDEFPAEAIATIWRMIISTSLNTEQNMSICAYVTADDNTCFWLAREYYGSFIKTIVENSADKVIENVALGHTAIGILPLDDKSPSPWWIRPENEKNNIYVFARIPFIERNDNIAPVLAIANVMPEDTNDDVSVIVVSSDKDEVDINEIFASQGVSIAVLSSRNNDHLIEADKFIAASSKLLENIENKLGYNSKIRLLGSYAAPIKS